MKHDIVLINPHLWQPTYGIDDYTATRLVSDADLSCFFERSCTDYCWGKRPCCINYHAAPAEIPYRNRMRPHIPKIVANWIMNDLLGALNKDGKMLAQSPVLPMQIGQLVDLIDNETISGKIAKDVFAEMYKTGEDPEVIVKRLDLGQLADPDAIGKIIDQILVDNPDNVLAYKSGKDKLFGFFVGQVMKVSQGKANPDMVNDILKKRLV